MQKKLIASAMLVLLTAVPSTGQDQLRMQRPVPNVPNAPVQQRDMDIKRAAPSFGNVQCPESITYTINPIGGWRTGSATAKLFNVTAMDGSRTDCIYRVEYATISKSAPPGQKCSVAPDRKSFICK